MKAILVHNICGPSIEIRNYLIQMRQEEVLIKAAATSINHLMLNNDPNLQFRTTKFPAIPCHDVSNNTEGAM